MDIQGLQKLTLLDWPGRVACTIFLGGCDFRCPFCHNRDLVTGPLPAAMDSGELLAFLAKRKGLLDGVCVTGGEPLLRPGLEALLEEIKALGFPIKLDTNGSHPQLLARLWSLGLVDYAAMDIKNSPERYGETAGVPGLDLGPIRESVSWLLESHVDYEFRTTVVRQFHDSASFRAIGLTGGEPLLRPGLEALLEEIKALGFPIKLDTNGSHPQLLARLWSLGLVDYAAMDIKNSPERYGETAGVPGLDLGPIRESVSWLLESHVDYEFRTTVVRQFHDSASFRAIGPWISGARRYFLQAFIDRDTVLRPGLSAWSREEMEGFAALVRPWVPAVELRGI